MTMTKEQVVDACETFVEFLCEELDERAAVRIYDAVQDLIPALGVTEAVWARSLRAIAWAITAHDESDELGTADAEGAIAAIAARAPVGRVSCIRVLRQFDGRASSAERREVVERAREFVPVLAAREVDRGGA